MAAPTSPPNAEPALRTLAMPADANANGDIFGGWVLAQMDLAGALPAVTRAEGRVATVAVEAMRFHAPINIGDLVTCYAEVARTGRTSITVAIETWARRRLTGAEIRVTEGAPSSMSRSTRAAGHGRCRKRRARLTDGGR